MNFVLSDPVLGGRWVDQLVLIETPQALQASLERSPSQDVLNRGAQRWPEGEQDGFRPGETLRWLV